MKRILHALSILVVLSLLCTTGYSQLAYKDQSVLASGTWHKIGVVSAGIHKIDYNFLTSDLGVNTTAVDPMSVRIFGNSGGPLPQRVGAPRIDDLEELGVMRVGMEDGSIDPGDFILFYAEGPDQWDMDEDGRFHMTKNVYDVKNHYFVGILEGQAVSIPTRESLEAAPGMTVTTYDDYLQLEEDRVNLLGKYRPPGSGKIWFGDEFSATRERTYTAALPHISVDADLHFQIQFAGRSGSPSVVTAIVNGNTFNKTIASTKLGEVEDAYAVLTAIEGTVKADQSAQNVVIRYPQQSGTTVGWLDYISLQTSRDLTMTGPFMRFRSIASAQASTVEYRVSGTTDNAIVWDITDRHLPIHQDVKYSNGTASFVVHTGSIVQEYLVFDPSYAFSPPTNEGPVANQNLHSIMSADLLIIYHEMFEEAATRLAEHRSTHTGYDVVQADVRTVYNEFSGGSVDATAIRDFAAMIRSRDPDFRFMLLVGDGTYDIRHLNKEQDDDNFIPVYETDESLDPIRAFPSDDYFALLNENEGDDLVGAIDIAVGRLPVSSPEEADAVVNKIIHYDVGSETLGDWRLKLTYIADDEDNNLHLSQSEDISGRVESAHQVYNLDRIYLDAFRQVSTPGGERYPDVNSAINRSIYKGALAINYLGHGGHLGWAQERILTLNDIQSWTNIDRLPVFVTATCSFTGYDEPSYSSAGEQVLLNPAGGAVALLTTVRAVYAGSNKRLTQAVFDRIFVQDDGAYRPLGETMRLAKNSSHQDTATLNARKFAIIGDPSMYLALPKHEIVITALNNSPVGAVSDTVRALDKVQLEGEVRDSDGNRLTQFSGKVHVTVFDKAVNVRTLGNDPKSYERNFQVQSRVIFKGSATVDNGSFSITFVVPKDINFEYGKGKISLYATDEISEDAAGSFEDIVIGGSSPSADTDDRGPDIQLFMDDESFVTGDVVGPNSTLIVNLSDTSGINVIGNSIGHDLEAILDNTETFILNEFYVATTDDYTSGEARFPLSGLEPGEHTITVTAWDVANNFSEAAITFVVREREGQVVHGLENIPNPFGVSTEFRFRHDLQSSVFDVDVDIFDVSGRLVRTVSRKNLSAGSGVISGIHWDGTGTSRAPLAHGIYFYRVRLRSVSANGTAEQHFSGFNKLILMN